MLRGILRELQAPAFPPGDDRDPHHTQGAATGRRNRKQTIGQREIELSFVGAGWRVTDDSSEHLTVGNCGKLSILAYGSCMGTGDAAFELLERRHVLTYWVRTIPTPRQAAVLLEEHGGRPEEERGNPHKQ